MGLSTQDRIYIEQRIANDRKSALVAYLLWFFLGLIGAHRLYLGRVGTGLLQLILGVGGSLTAFAVVGLVPLAIWALWWIWDAISIPGMISSDLRRSRRSLERELDDGGPPVNTRRWSRRDREAFERQRHGRIEPNAP